MSAAVETTTATTTTAAASFEEALAAAQREHEQEAALAHHQHTHRKKKKKKKKAAAATEEPKKDMKHWVPAATGEEMQQRVFKDFERGSQGGMRLNNDEELSKQRGIVWELAKLVGITFIEGKDLSNITLPIPQLFEPRSFLEKMTDAWGYLPTFLTKAAATKDPVERFKLTICFLLSGMYLTTTYKKPFNPILGETYQGTYSDGTQVFMEQTSHHPAVSNWQVIGPKSSFTFWGRGETTASALGNSIRGHQYGANQVDFADGGSITFELPFLLIKGIMWGDRVHEYSGTVAFRDAKNRLACDVVFNPDALGLVKSFFSRSKPMCDTVRGEIFRMPREGSSKSKKLLSTVEGCWLSHLDFNGERLWDISMVPHPLIPHPDPLPSDSRFREDLMALVDADFERTKEYKQLLEEKQRHEERLRKSRKKK